MTLSQIYRQLFAGETISVSCSLTQYNTLRAGLIRKFRISADACAALGDESMLNQYVACAYNSNILVGLFLLRDVADKKRKSVDYTVL